MNGGVYRFARVDSSDCIIGMNLSGGTKLRDLVEELEAGLELE